MIDEEKSTLPDCPHGINDGAPAPGHSGLCRHCIRDDSWSQGYAKGYAAGIKWERRRASITKRK